MEALFWNNYADASWLPNKDTIIEENREIRTPVFSRFYSIIRDTILWRVLICACYEEETATSAIEESGINAMIHILEEMLQEEILVAQECLAEEENGELNMNRKFIEYEYTRYRNLVISLCQELASSEDNEEEIELKILDNSHL